MATIAKLKSMVTQLAPSLSKLSLFTRTNIIYSLRSNSCNYKFTRHASSSFFKGMPKIYATPDDKIRYSPGLMLQPELDPETGELLVCFYSLEDKKPITMIKRTCRAKGLKVPEPTKCIGSTIGPWLVFADTKDGSLYLSHWYLNDVVELPSLGTLPQVLGVERDARTGSILHFKVAPSYYDCIWDNGILEPYDLITPEVMANNMISYLALSYDDPRDPNCVAMVVYGDNKNKRLAYCHIGETESDNYDKVWCGLQEEYCVTGTRNQVVYDCKKKLFYSICDEGILAFDVERDRGRRSKKVAVFYMNDIEFQRKEGLPKWLEDLEKKESCWVEYYLLTLKNGDLWLIVRHLIDKRNDNNNDSIPPYKTLHFDVFRVSYPGRLERVTYLEDRAIFIGFNQSFSVKEGDSFGVRPNCIYFTDDIREGGDRWGHDMGIFDMKNGCFTQFYPYNDEQKEKKVPITKPIIWISPVSDILFRKKAYEEG